MGGPVLRDGGLRCASLQHACRCPPPLPLPAGKNEGPVPQGLQLLCLPSEGLYEGRQHANLHRCAWRHAAGSCEGRALGSHAGRACRQSHDVSVSPPRHAGNPDFFEEGICAGDGGSPVVLPSAAGDPTADKVRCLAMSADLLSSHFRTITCTPCPTPARPPHTSVDRACRSSGSPASREAARSSQVGCLPSSHCPGPATAQSCHPSAQRAPPSPAPSLRCRRPDQRGPAAVVDRRDGGGAGGRQVGCLVDGPR